MKEIKTDYTVQSVDSALELLELIAEFPGRYSLQSLSEKIGLSRNKTFRILATLSEKNLVEKDPSTGAYHIGVLSVPLAQKFLSSFNITTYAHPVLVNLAEKHDEAVYMTVIKDSEVIFLDMVDCHHQIKAAPFIGKRVPFFFSAAGKVMKALDSRDLVERLLKRKEIYDGSVDLEKLQSELHEIRAKGVAVDFGGMGEGIISVAVAVRDYAGKVVGAITMLGPSFRMLAERLENEIIPSLREGAQVLSEKFGYMPSG